MLKEPKFNTGRLVITRGALMLLAKAGVDPVVFIRRHIHGDWGDCGTEDARMNDFALKHGGRIFSVYYIDERKQHKVWIITEHDRSLTTILLPEEY